MFLQEFMNRIRLHPQPALRILAGRQETKHPNTCLRELPFRLFRYLYDAFSHVFRLVISSNQVVHPNSYHYGRQTL